MRHVALNVIDLPACEHFYVDLLGMQVEWRPDPENVYLSSGIDNLALHKAPGAISDGGQRLDHIGFILRQPDDVDACPTSSFSWALRRCAGRCSCLCRWRALRETEQHPTIW